MYNTLPSAVGQINVVAASSQGRGDRVYLTNHAYATLSCLGSRTTRHSSHQILLLFMILCRHKLRSSIFYRKSRAGRQNWQVPERRHTPYGQTPSLQIECSLIFKGLTLLTRLSCTMASAVLVVCHTGSRISSSQQHGISRRLFSNEYSAAPKAVPRILRSVRLRLRIRNDDLMLARGLSKLLNHGSRFHRKSRS